VPAAGASGGSKEQRNVADGQAAEGLGVATTRTDERVLASKGLLSEASTLFTTENSVENGAVLLALPALASQGLLKGLEVYQALPGGYYNLTHILLLLSFMALLRIRNPEQLKRCNPGELGRVMGLDRVPEMRCLRQKIKLITGQDKAVAFEKSLFRQWVSPEENPCLYFYIDGHVRIYYGDKAKLSKTYVSRQKLCLSGTTEYWVNDPQGSPYLCVIGELNTHLKEMILTQIVPRLLEDTKEMINQEQLEADPDLPRFTLVFDREAYDTGFFEQLWQNHGIAIISYRKNVKNDWPESEFKEIDIQVINNKNTVRVCEHPVLLGGYRFREVRKLGEGGHQTSIITTNPKLTQGEIAGRMFSRWSQENYFKYAISEFGLDKMVQYGIEQIDEGTMVVNPGYTQLTRQIKTATEKKRRSEAELYELMEKLENCEKTQEQVVYIEKQASAKQAADQYEQKIKGLKIQRQGIKRTIALKDMPEATRYNCLNRQSKMFMNVIKMIAYRSETVLFNMTKNIWLNAQKEGRQMIQSILKSDADLMPDYDKNTLTVKIHGQATPKANQILQYLCEQINETETVYPGTNLTLIFKTLPT
jgi:hypothetical protein